MKFLISLFTIVIMAESCNSQKESISAKEVQEKNSSMQEELSGTYMVESIEAAKGFSEKLYISFDASTKAVTGFSGCNTFFGNYTTDGKTITFGPLATSKKYCQEGQNNIERQFLDALGKVDSYDIKEGFIYLSNNNGQLVKANKQLASKPSKSDVVKDNYNRTLITYRAQSRGMFEFVQISESEVKISSDRNLKNIKSYDWEPKDWDALSKMIKDIDDEKFQKLKAPTDKRLYDGAAHATLSIIRGDVEIISPSFDHGAPPKEIEDLVNKVLSIRDKASKQ